MKRATQNEFNDWDLARLPIHSHYDLRGIDWSKAGLVGMRIAYSDLEGVDFRKRDMAGAYFYRCDVRCVNWSGADLSRACFAGCQMDGGIFTGAKMPLAAFNNNVMRDTRFGRVRGERAECQLTKNFNMKKAMAAIPSSRLEMGAWHKYENTVHCLAGWAITVHPEGEKLEKLVGPATAATILLAEGGLPIPDFRGTLTSARRWWNKFCRER